jgi:hypothetical protein
MERASSIRKNPLKALHSSNRDKQFAFFRAVALQKWDWVARENSIRAFKNVFFIFDWFIVFKFCVRSLCQGLTHVAWGRKQTQFGRIPFCIKRPGMA